MSDYTYDANEQVRLGDDRAANHASALPSYSLELRPDPSWPGLTGSSGEFRMQPQGVRDIAGWLREQQSAMRDVAIALSQAAGGVSFGPGTWAEANQLQLANETVMRAVDEYAAKLSESIFTAAQSLESAAQAATDADGSIASGVRSIQGTIAAD